MERLEARQWLSVGCVLLMSLCAAGQGRIVYVDDDAVGVGNGSSWADAYMFLQDALAEAADSFEPVEVRVAQGVYKPDRDADRPSGTGDRKASFRLLEGVALKGGFAGLGDADPDARDVALYETILSGDLKGDDVPVGDPCDLLTEPTRDDNSQGVVTVGPCSRATVLEGFTIRSGKLTASRSSFGAGLFVAGEEAPSCPSVRDCTFIDHLGPSVLVRNGYPEIVDCSFADNAARSTGGAIYTWNTSVSPDCEFVIKGCTFAGNYAGEYGGAIHAGSWDRSVTIEDSTFAGNRAASGGAIYVGSAGAVSIRKCRFTHNVGQGGAVFIGNEATVDIVSCLFAQNMAKEAGGAVYIRQANLSIVSCVFAGNDARNGSAVANLQSRVSSKGVSWPSITITNSILQNVGAEIVTGEWADLNVTYSNVKGGWPGVGNIDVDPLFARLGHWDANGTPGDPGDDVWIEGDYHLKSQAGRWDRESESWVQDEVTSPCIDAGDPNSPIGDEPAPNGGVINVGFYGGTAEASRSPS